MSHENNNHVDHKSNKSNNNDGKSDADASPIRNLSWQQLQQTLIDKNLLPTPIRAAHVARGFSGLPPDKTPALVGARRGSINCPNTDPRVENVLSSMLAFWNEPRGTRDQDAGFPEAEYTHPFIPPPLLSQSEVLTPKTSRRRYLTFEPDTGGWNNIRMSLEVIVTLAALSGRTLVLPPEQAVYLLEARKGDNRKGRNYHDFFNLTENQELLHRVPIITSEEFLKLEGGDDGIVPLKQYNSTYKEHLWSIAKWCEERKKSDVYCEDLYDHYLLHGQLAPMSAEFPNENCMVFDVDVFTHGEGYISKIDSKMQKRIETFCRKRVPIYYNRTMHEAKLWHFETMDFRHRLLVHYYAFMFFTDPKVGNYYKRFVRDFLRYHDEVWCAAGKIILALQYENYSRNLLTSGDRQLSTSSLDLDLELVGGYSSLHIRRGDLQFKEVKFDSQQWYMNTKEIWKPNEILYIATDERNQTFFDDFRKLHSGPLRYFDDYKQLAELDTIDPTLYGMIDTVVASRGAVFAGTWFSTFSGYIIRLRGYYGMSKFFSYYSWLDRKYFMHSWMEVGDGSYYAREYPTGWTSIDGDLFVDNDNELEMEHMKHDALEILIADRYSNEAKDDRANKGDIAQDVNHLGRGVAGRPMESTPALIGARRGQITCDTNVDSLAYWNEPQGDRDSTFTTPFGVTSSKPKYLVFTPDRGGFNNIRMSFEIIFIIAAALGRILVLPPEQPMYLLRNDGAKKHRGLDGFFYMSGDYYKERVRFITMEQFIRREGNPGGQFPVPVEKMDDLLRASRICAPGRHGTKISGDPSCDVVHEYLEQHATTPNITATHHQCLVFDKGMFDRGVPDDSESANEFCSSGKRQLVYATKQMQEPSLLYIQGGKPPTRMLAHYYGYLHFTDVSIGNYYKRYVRDLLHFRHEIFCAAGKIVKFLQDEAALPTDSEGGGGYSSLHIRRGDFQYKKMKVSADEWYKNTEDVWLKNEILYIATDEKDKAVFFEPFRKAGHKIFFLSDFNELAGLDNMDPNWMGMIDVVVASRGRAFAGTFRSTFSGYINRLRGYYGMSMKDSWFGQLSEKRFMHEWHNVNLDTYAKEWPDAWAGIDADVAPSQDIF
ncbi:hypothetical protein ACHAXR_009712 [Thalassiosira sp. AJA248-18]